LIVLELTAPDRITIPPGCVNRFRTGDATTIIQFTLAAEDLLIEVQAPRRRSRREEIAQILVARSLSQILLLDISRRGFSE
jgi:hypothetical protein